MSCWRSSRATDSPGPDRWRASPAYADASTSGALHPSKGARSDVGRDNITAVFCPRPLHEALSFRSTRKVPSPTLERQLCLRGVALRCYRSSEPRRGRGSAGSAEGEPAGVSWRSERVEDLAAHPGIAKGLPASQARPAADEVRS